VGTRIANSDCTVATSSRAAAYASVSFICVADWATEAKMLSLSV
jgi:hypothetical protein